MTLDSYVFTSRGGRSRNEDAVGSSEIPGGGVFVVADGLGGHLDGEQASKCAVDTILARQPTRGELLTDWLAAQIGQANANILELQRQRRSNMKSTVAALVVRRTDGAWANVGDSRVYYLHNRAIADFTEDHSVAYKKYKAGQITRAQISTDEDQSLLLRALGSPERNQPGLGSAGNPIEPGDGFFLCSDGMWEYIQDEEILADFLQADTAQAWGELLLARARKRTQPGNDNLSLITVMVKN